MISASPLFWLRINCFNLIKQLLQVQCFGICIHNCVTADDFDTLRHLEGSQSFNREVVCPAQHGHQASDDRQGQNLNTDQISSLAVLHGHQYTVRVLEESRVERTPNNWQDVDLAVLQRIVDLKCFENSASEEIARSCNEAGDCGKIRLHAARTH